MNNSLINTTAKYSLITQISTLIIDYLALQIEIPNKLLILRQLLTLEFIVQIIESSFYIWLISYFHLSKDITTVRYYDWGITTNIMLFILIIYVNHLQTPEKTMSQLYNENKQVIHSVIILNTLMLLIGYMGEINKIKINKAVFIGFIPFLIYYKIIYQTYVKDDILIKNNVSTDKTNEIKMLFWYFFIVWSMYGVTALFPYIEKNISYNILDLFSKNFFGLFLSYKIYTNKVNSTN
jgi:hypothetical protein